MSDKKRRPRRVKRDPSESHGGSPYQAPFMETQRAFPTAQFLTPDGVIAFPANDIALCAALWNAIQEGAR